MTTIEDRIKEIEEEIHKTKYNKATESHIGLLKAKMAKLQIDAEKAGHSGGKGGFSIPKSGDASIALVGYPNVGKSSLLNAITGTESEVGNFAFTTLTVIPGTLKYKGTQIQILDLPGIIDNAAIGSGRGREVLSMVRSVDLILLISDSECKGMERIIEELRKSGIVINRERKNISMRRMNTGGIKIRKPRSLALDETRIKAIAKEFKLTNLELYIRENITDDDLIDFFRGNVVYVPALVVVNKIDIPHNEEKVEAMKRFGDIVRVSASSKIGIDELKETMYGKLKLVRVYLRNKAGVTDFERPLVLTEGATIREVCRKISREMIDTFRYAIITSEYAKIRDMRVGLDYGVSDEDVVTVISKF